VKKGGGAWLQGLVHSWEFSFKEKLLQKLRIEENLDTLGGWSGRFKLLISLGHVTGN
jgi:hypothetical protein